MLGELQINEPTIAVAMIVKDEEANIGKCIESIHDYVQWIVIADTGSTDATIEIARSYPKVKLFEIEWNDSFSEARNESIRLAEEHTDCDWIFVFDADEMLMDDSGKFIKSAIEESDEAGGINAIKCTVISVMPDGKDGRHQPERIFRRGTIRYTRRAHNQPRYRGKWAMSAISIYHTGYNLYEAAKIAKAARTERLLEMELEDDPYSPISTMYMIKCLRGQKRWVEMIDLSTKFYNHLLEEGLTITPQVDQIIRTDTITAFQGSNQIDTAMNLAQESVKKYPQNLDLMWSVAKLYTVKSMWQESIGAYNRFIYMRDMAARTGLMTNIIQDRWGYTGNAFHNIAMAHFKLGDIHNALLAIYLATGIEPECELFQNTLMMIFNEAVTGYMAPAFEKAGIVHDLEDYRGCQKCGAIFKHDSDQLCCNDCQPQIADLEVLTVAEEL